MTSRSAQAKSFAHRNGDAAEAAFLAFAKHRNFKVERYGFDRTPLPHFHTLPVFVRHTPDFVATRGRSKEGFLVECKAGGNGSVINIKVDDWSPLALWNKFTDGNLHLFFNDSKNRKVAFVPFRDVVQVLVDHPDDVGEGVWESDGVKFRTFPKKFFDWIDYNEFQ